MTLEELIKTTNPQDREQVKTLQRALQSQGYYNGGIDGIWKGKTASGIKAFRDYQLRVQQAQAQKNQADADKERIRAKLEAEKVKNDPLNQFSQYGPLGVGLLGGAATNYFQNKGSEAKRVRDITALANAVRQNQVSSGAANQTLKDINRSRNFRRFGSLGLIPLGAFGASYITEQQADKFDKDSAIHNALNIAASGERGFGVGYLASQIKNLATADPANQVDITRIRDGATAVGSRAAQTSGASGDFDRDVNALKGKNTAAALRAEAARLGVNTTSRMNKTDLAKALINSGKKISNKMWQAAPIIAGSLAAGLTAMDQAEAAGLGPVGQTATGLGTAATVGAGVYGATKGAQKAAGYLGQYPVARMLGKYATRAVPAGMAAMTTLDILSWLSQGKNSYPSPDYISPDGMTDAENKQYRKQYNIPNDDELDIITKNKLNSHGHTRTQGQPTMTPSQINMILDTLDNETKGQINQDPAFANIKALPFSMWNAINGSYGF